ncbi:hypothetical protein L7F22_051054 [Adiantum nelumboides]|nr:hypothetical protein [Adiantum nelumboides]
MMDNLRKQHGLNVAIPTRVGGRVGGEEEEEYEGRDEEGGDEEGVDDEEEGGEKAEKEGREIDEDYEDGRDGKKIDEGDGSIGDDEDSKDDEKDSGDDGNGDEKGDRAKSTDGSVEGDGVGASMDGSDEGDGVGWMVEDKESTLEPSGGGGTPGEAVALSSMKGSNEETETRWEQQYQNEEIDLDRGRRDVEVARSDASARSSRRWTTDWAQRRAQRADKGRRREEDYIDTSKRSRRNGSTRAKDRYHSRWITELDTDPDESSQFRWKINTGKASRRKEREEWHRSRSPAGHYRKDSKGPDLKIACPIFKGKKHDDPDVHIQAFEQFAELKNILEEKWGEYFPHILKEAAMKWYYHYPASKLQSYKKLKKALKLEQRAKKEKHRHKTRSFDSITSESSEANKTSTSASESKEEEKKKKKKKKRSQSKKIDEMSKKISELNGLGGASGKAERWCTTCKSKVRHAIAWFGVGGGWIWWLAKLLVSC